MLNIKNPEAHRLAKELAAIEGTTLTEAVTRALEAALKEHGIRRQARHQVLQGLVASARAHGTPAAMSAFDDMYDEAGLPR